MGSFNQKLMEGMFLKGFAEATKMVTSGQYGIFLNVVSQKRKPMMSLKQILRNISCI